MAKVAGWDQRAVALVSLRGTETDRRLFEEGVAAQGWEVLEKDGPELTPSTGGDCSYMVELRFRGSSYRAATGARERLEDLADRIVLDLSVEAVQLVDRDPLDLPVWYAYQQPRLGPCTTPLPLRERVRERAADWWAVTSGGSDTGRQVRAAGAAGARALAARPLPGAPPAPAGVRVRRSMGARPPAHPPPRRRGPMRQFAMVRLPALLALVCGAWIGVFWDRGVAAWWPVLPVLVLAAAAAVVILRRAVPVLSFPGAAAAAAAAVGGVAAVGVNGVVKAPDAATGFLLVAVGLGFGYLVGTGIWLLVRQSSWRRTLPWLLPGLLPLVVVLLPGLGLALPAAYLDAFELDLEDVDVPAVWRLIGALRVAVALSLWLLTPALLGYAKHLHLMVRDRWMGYATAAVLSLYCVLQGAWVLIVEPAAASGSRAVADAAAGRTPPPYYGITPEWMCVQPVGDLNKVPVEGGALDPGTAYLLMGDAGGRAVLWDAGAKAALKVPLASLRLVPADDPRRPCP
ncbi:hypothetical protein ABZY44_32155 [Streptomyces sp. NPDC006544]|uniref:hypothetical protein n=1 Tax=Streptomyces sp. NPDC006544 TaxID=3154583 RepID=UPI0033A9275B